jgi:hypothetical protein
VQPGQRIHESVFELLGKGYTPLALLHDGTLWKDVYQRKEEIMEPDLFTNAKILMDKLGEKLDVSEEDSHALLTLLASGKQLLARRLLLLLIILIRLSRCRSQSCLRCEECYRNFTAGASLQVRKDGSGCKSAAEVA